MTDCVKVQLSNPIPVRIVRCAEIDKWLCMPNRLPTGKGQTERAAIADWHRQNGGIRKHPLRPPIHLSIYASLGKGPFMCEADYIPCGIGGTPEEAQASFEANCVAAYREGRAFQDGRLEEGGK
ncbi:MAG: hypothetical protein IMZ50_16495 [Candidatus Atribacteria bacterium]|nr:hypothetical protein [Candidatus Atribacteria bacterium]